MNTTRFPVSLLRSQADPFFGGLCRIYSESLPVREQKPLAELGAMVARVDYRFVLMTSEDQCLGFCIFFVPLHMDFSLLEYMAVDQRHRESGLGSELFKRSAGIAGIGDRLMLIEVDSDREVCADRDQRTRRRHFYERLDCRRVENLAYLLPLAGVGQPPEMDLMIRNPAAGPAISKSRLTEWISTVFRDVYSCKETDPRIGRMMAPISDPVRLA